MLNLFRIDKCIDDIDFYPLDNDYVTDLYFSRSETTLNEIKFSYYNNRIDKRSCVMFFYDEESLSEYHKREFYYSVFRHFFKKEIKVSYKLIDRDVPLKPFKVE